MLFGRVLGPTEVESDGLRVDLGGPLPAGRKPLNRPLSSFLGRRPELALLAQLATSRRLVTLVGPGGAGKTRLAVEYAADAHPWFVRLADLTDPDLVPAAVAEAAGVKGSALTAALADRPGLLVLDNCEHLADAVADFVLELLAACPSVRVLATSREPLGVDGEHLLPIAPLPAADAVDLLTDRIAAIRPGWQPDPAESGRVRPAGPARDRPGRHPARPGTGRRPGPGARPRRAAGSWPICVRASPMTSPRRRTRRCAPPACWNGSGIAAGT